MDAYAQQACAPLADAPQLPELDAAKRVADIIAHATED
jgi:hypothetical protein